MDPRNPIRSASLLYIGSFAGMALGFLYWVLVARASTPEVVGIAATAFTLMTLLMHLSNLGVARGLQRFLGNFHRNDRIRQFRRYLGSGLAILLGSTTIVVICTVILNEYLQVTFSMSSLLVVLIVVTLVFANLDLPLQLALVSTMRTGYVALSGIVSGLVKISVGLYFVTIGLGPAGIVLGLLAMYGVALVLDLALTWLVLQRHPIVEEREEDDRERWLQIIKSGVPTYVPSVIQTIGTSAGILMLFGIVGAASTGLYYMALQLFVVLTLLPNTVMGLLYPYVCGFPERDGAIMKQGMKLALLFSFPMFFALLLYPFVPLSIMGAGYVEASIASQILILGMPLVVVISGISYLAYARGNYRVVLAIGIGTNLPRVVLYSVLSEAYAATGASLAFLIGTMVGFMVAVLAARRMCFSLGWSDIILAAFPPLTMFFIVWILALPWIIGVPSLIAISLIAYMKTRILSRDELVMISQALLPEAISDRFESHLAWFLRIMCGD